jgi:hypothetical protein
MNRLEEEYKNRFKGQESLQGIDADDIWAGISEGIGHSSPTPKQSKTIVWKIVTTTTILILLLWGFCSRIDTEKENIANIQNYISPSNDLKQKPDIAPVINSTSNTKNESGLEEYSEDKSTKNQSALYIHSKTSTANSENLVSQKSNTSTSDQHVINLANQNNSKDENSTVISNKNISKEIVYEPNAQKENPTNVKTTDAQFTKIESFNFLPTLAIQPLEIKVDVSNFPKVKNPESKKLRQAQTNQFQMAVYSGVNSMFTHYTDKNTNPELSEELTTSNTPEIGFSSSLRLSWLRNGKYSLSTGIDFDNIRIKFQTVKETETTVLDENYLTGFSIDPMTGDTIDKVYEAIQRRANKKRSVLHHNTFKLISIPLEIGIQQQKGKFGLGLNLGLSANFFVAQNGKTLNKDREIQTIEEELPFSKFSFSYHLNPFVDYTISKKVSVRISPVVRYQSHGVSKLYGLKQYSIFTSINGGFVFKL